MTRPRLSLRRALAVTGAAALGLTASLAVASPASAHHPIVTGQAICDTETGNWKVTWTVANSERDIEGKITSVVTVPESTLTTIVPGATLPRKGKGVLTDEQMVAGDRDWAKLTVTAEWTRKGKFHQKRTITKSAWAKVKFDGTCEAPQSKPRAKFASDCEGVTVTLINRKGATKPADFTVTGEGGFEEKVTVVKGREAVRVPAENAGKITVTEGGQLIKEYSWQKPEDCEEPNQPASPEVSYESTCDELIVEFDNPQDGADFTATVTPSQGEAQTVTVATGETATVKFPAAEGLTVTISVEGQDDVTVAWEKPEDCEAPGEGGGDGDDKDTLPVTGAQAGAIAGGAALLLAAGVGIFLLARRRRITFTA